MRIKCIWLLVILCTITGYAQNRTQNLGDVNEIKIFNGLSVDIERAAEAKIVITGEKTDDVVVKNVNGRLKLSLKFPETFNADKVKIKVYYNQDLITLDANEGGAIFSETVLEQQKLTVKTQEGAYIHIPVKVKYINIKAVTGGAIKLRGTVTNQEVEVTTGGDYEGYDLISESADVVAADGAKAEIFVSDLLDARVRLGGKIYYKGNPEKVTTKKIIGGTIRNKG